MMTYVAVLYGKRYECCFHACKKGREVKKAEKAETIHTLPQGHWRIITRGLSLCYYPLCFLGLDMLTHTCTNTHGQMLTSPSKHLS